MHIQKVLPYQSTVFTSRNGHKQEEQSKKSGFGSNVLVSTLIALSSLSPVSASSISIDKTNDDIENVVNTDDESTSIRFKENGNKVVELSDFEYSSSLAKKDSHSYLKGLNRYKGKQWTQATKDLAENLASVYSRSHTYAFDLNTDELVKDKSYITYDKAGRVLSTMVITPYGDETVVKYKYNRDGNISSAEYVGDRIIEYRKDGTRFSSETTDFFAPKETILYNRKGNMVYKSIVGRHNTMEAKFDDNGNLISHYSKDENSGSQKIYNGGELLLTTFYDGNGRFKYYTDDYFERKGEDIVVGGYLSTRKVHYGEDYNVLYRESPIDGKITNPIRQGTSGTCYAAGVVNSLVRISAGRRLLDRALPNDFDKNVCIVEFKGLGKRYSIPSGVISHNMSRLGRRDGDYAGMIYAYERFRESDEFINRELNLPEYFYTDHRGSSDRRVDSGTPKEFYYALTGKNMSESGDRITDADIQKARRCLATGKGIVNAGTIMRENKDDEIPLSDRAFGVFPKHNVAIVGIDDRNVVIYDSVTEKETAYPITKFKKYFSKLYWATVEE